MKTKTLLLLGAGIAALGALYLIFTREKTTTTVVGGTGARDKGDEYRGIAGIIQASATGAGDILDSLAGMFGSEDDQKLEDASDEAVSGVASTFGLVPPP